ncbi:MAG: allantoinase AllB [Chloroflexota bacterium]
MSRVIQSQRVVIGDEVRPAVIRIEDGKITAIEAYLRDAGSGVEDFGTHVIMPGCIDIHVHVNEPGRADWEGFETATRAAAYGGITSLMEMPLNSDPSTVTLDALNQKIASTEGKLSMNVGLYAGVVPGQVDELDAMLRKGAIAGKAFMIYSGMDDFQWSDPQTLREGMQVLVKHNKPLLAHAEVMLDSAVISPEAVWTSYQHYLNARPPEFELEAIKILVDLCRETGCAVHVVHLSAIEGLELINAAKAEGLPITVETCPHYLYFAAEDIPDGQTQFKCAPPIRAGENRTALRAALAGGQLDLVATDHAPCLPALKKMDIGDFKTAWGGIFCLQLFLPSTWTAMKESGVSLPQLAQLVATRPAEVVGLSDRGKVEPGYVADLVVWDPDSAFEVTADRLQHRHKISPYLGERLYGETIETILGGETVFAKGSMRAEGQGSLLTQ